MGANPTCMELKIFWATCDKVFLIVDCKDINFKWTNSVNKMQQKFVDVAFL